MPAFRLAWEQGADAIEGDFLLTKDGKIICIHHVSTKRLAKCGIYSITTDCPELLVQVFHK